MRKTLTRTKRWTEWLTDNYAETLRTFQRLSTESSRQLRISIEGDVMPPHFLFFSELKGQRFGLLCVVKPLRESVSKGRTYKSLRRQIWQRQYPRSCHPNPFDYYGWGVTERELNQQPYNTISLTSTISTIDKDYLILHVNLSYFLVRQSSMPALDSFSRYVKKNISSCKFEDYMTYESFTKFM